MSKLTYRSEKKVKWVSHTAAGKDPSGYISLGTAHTDEVRPVAGRTAMRCCNGFGIPPPYCGPVAVRGWKWAVLKLSRDCDFLCIGAAHRRHGYGV